LRHLAYNGANDRVTVREVGCGAEAGRALFYSLPDSAEGTFGVVPQTGLNQTEIEITTIDKESAQFGYVPSLIKIDVEGAEWSVLRGAVNTLRSAKPVLLLSLHPTALAQQSVKLEEILGWLTEQAYDWREIGRDHEVHIVAHPIQPALT
jgi:FkbM family methyltransferase